MKRFWTTAAVTPEPEGFGVALDGRPVRLPKGAPLAVPSLALAEAVAAEWQVAGPEFDKNALPLTGLAGAALERIPTEREGMIDALLAYGGSDLLCYRAPDPELAELQHQSWQVWLDWAVHTLDAPLIATDAIIAIDQPPASLAALRAHLTRQDDYGLAGLSVMVPALSSLILALAVLAAALSPDAAHRLASLEEAWQAARWGEDNEAAARRRQLAVEIATVADFVTLARS